MKSFNGLESGEIICRDSYGNFKYYLTVFGVGAFTWLWISAIVYLLFDPDVNFFKFDFKTITFILFPIILLWFTYTTANECRFEYYVVYYDDFLVFCFIEKPLFKKSEILNSQLTFQSVLNFHTGGQHHNTILFRHIEEDGKESDLIPLQTCYDELNYWRGFKGWCLVKEHENKSNEIVDFLNQRVQEIKLK